MLCVGMFGTCGGSRWRETHLIPRYDKLGIDWYNPQVEGWDPSMADVEAEHLANDALILFSITDETYGFGSLAETGFSMLQAIRLDERRDFVIFIAQDVAERDPRGKRLDDRLNEDGTPNPRSQARESLRTRALVRQHLIRLRLSNVYVVDGLEEMLEVSLVLWESAKMRWPLRELNPHRNARQAPVELCKTRCLDCGHVNRWHAFKWPSTEQKREHNRVNSETCVKCGSTNVVDVEDEEVMAPHRAAARVLADVIRGADEKPEDDE